MFRTFRLLVMGVALLLAAGLTRVDAQTAPPAAASTVAATAAETAAFHDLNAAAGNSATQGEALDGQISDFQHRFPQSASLAAVSLLGLRYNQVHQNYLKELMYGEQVLRLAPTNLYALSLLGSIIPDSVKDSDLDRDQRLEEAEKDDRAAIAILDGIHVDPVTGADFGGNHYSTTTMLNARNASEAVAYRSLGRVALMRGDASMAASEFTRTLSLQPTGTATGDWIWLAQAQEGEHDYAAAAASLDQAATASSDNAAFEHIVTSEQTKLKAMQNAAGTPH